MITEATGDSVSLNQMFIPANKQKADYHNSFSFKLKISQQILEQGNDPENKPNTFPVNTPAAGLSRELREVGWLVVTVTAG